MFTYNNYVCTKKKSDNYTYISLDETMEGRWRHTATLINESVVIIIGGCTTGGRVLNDIILLDTSNWKIEKVFSVL